MCLCGRGSRQQQCRNQHTHFRLNSGTRHGFLACFHVDVTFWFPELRPGFHFGILASILPFDFGLPTILHPCWLGSAFVFRVTIPEAQLILLPRTKVNTIWGGRKLTNRVHAGAASILILGGGMPASSGYDRPSICPRREPDAILRRKRGPATVSYAETLYPKINMGWAELSPQAAPATFTLAGARAPVRNFSRQSRQAKLMDRTTS